MNSPIADDTPFHFGEHIFHFGKEIVELTDSSPIVDDIALIGFHEGRKLSRTTFKAMVMRWAD